MEGKKQELQNQLQELHILKEDLEYVLENHKATGQCCLTTNGKLRNNNGRPLSPPDIKPFHHHITNNTTTASNNTTTSTTSSTSTTTNSGIIAILPPYNKLIDQRVKTEIIEPLPSLTTPSSHDEALLFSEPPLKKLMLNPEVSITTRGHHQTIKPNRPNTLNVNNNNSNVNNNNNNRQTKNVSDLTGITIQTPSSGIQFNFESLMVGGTGLTPVNAPLVPNCGQQQRIPTSSADMNLTSPDARSPPKLVSL